MIARTIAIYGAGGFAREVAWLLSTLEKPYSLLGYIEDNTAHGRMLHGEPVWTWDMFLDANPKARVTVAVGSPKTREKLVRKCAEAGLGFATLVHQSVEMSNFNVRLGEGTIVCCGSILTVDIEIGKHVHVNLDCTIGHDVRIGDFATLSPGVHVSGNVHIGAGAYIGTGASIINGTSAKPLVIGEHAVIGAGACVTKDVEPGCLYAGVPAVLKKRY